MKAPILALALLTLPTAAQAAVLAAHCTLTEELGGSTLSADEWIGWDFKNGFDRPGGVLPLETAGAKAEITVIRDVYAIQGFTFRLHLLDKTTSREVNQQFDESTVIRSRPEGHIAVSCVVDA